MQWLCGANRPSVFKGQQQSQGDLGRGVVTIRRQRQGELVTADLVRALEATGENFVFYANYGGSG